MIIYPVGTILILLGIATALLATLSYTLVVRGNQQALSYGRIATYATVAAGLAVTVLLIYAFMARRYDIAYVNNYSSNILEPAFRFAAIWAGQPGSFLVWAMIGLLAAPLLIRRTAHFEPYVLAVFMLLQAALLFFMLVRNPFVPLADANGLLLTPTDGKGLNPLLHNFWMIIHPPILFTGYSLLALPFAFALAGLWRRDYDTWVARAMPWTLAGWAFLGLALMLGGYWAYETLGWGGYWAWDPVENSALVPWLLTTALLHGMLVQRTHGGLRRTNFFLAIAMYVLVIYATFLTRTGVLSNFSVHSFVEEGLTYIMTGFLLMVMFAGLFLFVLRYRDIPGRALSDKLISRDSFFLLGILTITAIAVIVGLGTSMPVISAIQGVGPALQGVLAQVFDIIPGENGQFALATEFFQRSTPPLGLVVITLMAVGPLLGWRDTNFRNLYLALRWPVIVTFLVTCVAILVMAWWGGGVDALSLGYISLSTLAIGTNLLMIIKTLRSGWMRIGGYFAHIGVAVLMCGFVGSTVYAQPEQQQSIQKGDSVTVYGYTITFNEYQLLSRDPSFDPNDPASVASNPPIGVMNLTVQSGNEQWTAQPQLYFNEQMGSTVATPAIRSHLWEDIYISPVEYKPEENPNQPILGRGDTTVSGPYSIAFQGFEIDMEEMMSGAATEVGATLLVTYNGESTTVTPRIGLVPNETDPAKAFIDLPATLPGGHPVSLLNFDPTRRLILLDITGLALPVTPARAVITISTKPAVLLVWIGAVVMVLGGAIAVLRRRIENQARLSGQPARLPRGLGGLLGRPGRAR